MKEGRKIEKFKVIIKEEYIRTTEVEAVDKAKALDKIITQYRNEDIVLDTVLPLELTFLVKVNSFNQITDIYYTTSRVLKKEF